MRIFKIRRSASCSALSSLGLVGCATGFPTKVSRYPGDAGAAGPELLRRAVGRREIGGLEFYRYAAWSRRRMEAQGYAAAASPQPATMLVRVGYGVDQGTTSIDSDPFGPRLRPFGFGGFDPFLGVYHGRPYYSRSAIAARRSPFYYGWDDPFWSPCGYGDGSAATRSTSSHLDMDIRRRGRQCAAVRRPCQGAVADRQSRRLVPNLIDAMFTGFPGRRARR